MGRRQAGRVVRQTAVVAVGLALGLGAIALFKDPGKPGYRPQPRSVSEFAFPTVSPGVPADGPPGEAAPAPDVEPADARTALVTVLQMLADGKPERAYPLLDGPSRKRFPSLATWINGQANLAQPLAFELGASRPAPALADAVDFDVAATHRPSLDAFRGLVPARSQSVWEVRRESGKWRVGAGPVSDRPVLPAEASATPIVQGWVTRLAACDTPGAASLQVGATLYGPTALVAAPCEKKGTWTAGAPVGLDHTPDPKAFLAAFGPEVGTWARLVPVQGPGTKFLVAVAPMGDGWQVMGVAVDG